MQKHELRKKKLQERLLHESGVKTEKDSIITKRLIGLQSFKKAKTVLLYLPVHGEVNLESFFAKKHLDKKWVLPRVKDKESLHLFRIDNLKDVEKGSFNLVEPKPHLKKATIGSLDLVLVPGVAFAPDGHRIGYGKGFYDRLLKKTKCPKIGIAYEFQIVDNIPCEPHDCTMDMIITEKKIYKIHK
jgi:5-formyltetrahydrofolate cyclo-ligase